MYVILLTWGIVCKWLYDWWADMLTFDIYVCYSIFQQPFNWHWFSTEICFLLFCGRSITPSADCIRFMGTKQIESVYFDFNKLPTDWSTVHFLVTAVIIKRPQCWSMKLFSVNQARLLRWPRRAQRLSERWATGLGICKNFIAIRSFSRNGFRCPLGRSARHCSDHRATTKLDGFPTSVPTLDAMDAVALAPPKPMDPVTAPMVPPKAKSLT